MHEGMGLLERALRTAPSKRIELDSVSFLQSNVLVADANITMHGMACATHSLTMKLNPSDWMAPCKPSRWEMNIIT